MKKPKKTATGRTKAVEAPPKGGENTRECLIKAAKRLFCQFGLDGTTVRKIADRAGVNVSLVSYHFQGKEGLYSTCLEQFGKHKLEAAKRILQTPHTMDEVKVRLQMFVEELYDGFLKDPDVVKIINREAELDRKLSQDIFRDTFLKFFETLVDFIKVAQKKNLLKPHFDPHIASMLFFGSVTHQMRVDSLNESFFGLSLTDPRYRKKVIDHALSFFLEGFAHEIE